LALFPSLSILANYYLPLNGTLGIPMKTDLPIIKRGAFVEGVIVTLIAFFLFNYFFDYEEKVFGLMFNSFDNQIQEVSVTFNNSQILFAQPEFQSIGTNKNTLKFLIPNNSGRLNLKVKTINGQYFSLNAIEYKSGEFNYITQQDEKIIYIKAHWQ